MASNAEEPQIILYDLACVKNTCFSPAVWRVRLILNYKRIPYTTVFLEFPDIAPTLKSLGLPQPTSKTGIPTKYTVPVLQHLPTKAFISDSIAIAIFLEKTYPSPPLTMQSPLGDEIGSLAIKKLGPVMRASISPRELHILALRAQEYFRKGAEEGMGYRLEEFIDRIDIGSAGADAGADGGARADGDVHVTSTLTPEERQRRKEDVNWASISPDLHDIGNLLQTHADEGPFILGAEPSLADFFITGGLENARVIDEGVFQRFYAYEGFKRVYDACVTFMGKRD